MSFEFKPIETAEKCPHCGAVILAGTLPPLFGMPGKTINLECSCVTKRKEAEEQRRKQQAHLEYIAQIRLDSGMDLAERQCRLSDFKPRRGIEKDLEGCKRYVQKWEEMRQTGKGLLFIGNTGSGKTHLAAGIANELIDQGVKVLFIKATDYLKKIKSTYHSNSKSQTDFTELYQKSPLLILDDLGIGKSSEWSMDELHCLIDYRYSNFKPTIITTNLALVELDKALDARTIDRILDKNKERFAILTLAVDSYRKAKH
jgi:DNA replication protein DnaC